MIAAQQSSWRLAAGTMLILLSLAACEKDRCKDRPPAFQLDVTILQGVDHTQASSLEVTLDLPCSGGSRTRSFVIGDELKDGSTSIAFHPGEACKTGIEGNIRVRVKNGAAVLAEGGREISGSGDACNFFSIQLGKARDGGVERVADLALDGKAERSGFDGKADAPLDARVDARRDGKVDAPSDARREARPDGKADAAVDLGPDLPCGPTTCPAGCCGKSGECVDSDSWNCGLDGQPCQSCKALETVCKTNGTCVSGQCTFTQSNINKECFLEDDQGRCDSSGECCTGCLTILTLWVCIDIFEQNGLLCGRQGDPCQTCREGLACVAGQCVPK